MKQAIQHPQQLGFDSMLKATDAANEVRLHELEDADLPDSMTRAIPFMHELISTHHAAMLRGDREAAMQCRDDAARLARKLNGYEPGILADDDAPGCVLDRATAASEGTVPLWGQSGNFIIECAGMRVRIVMEGIFGIGNCMPWIGFAAYAVEHDKPFLSETGYRSFLGITEDLQPGFTVDALVCEVITAHVARELKGKLLVINRAFALADSNEA